MSFWLHESKITTRLRSVSQRKRCLLAALIFVAGASSIYFNVVLPAKTHMNRDQLVLNDLKKKHQELCVFLSERDQVMLDHACLKERYDSNQAQKINQQQVVAQLLENIKQSQLVCHELIPKKGTQGASSIVMSLDGLYGSFVNFFELLLSRHVPCTVSKLDIVHHGAQQLRMNVVMEVNNV